ncbi:MAG: AbrB/MazE/SpoVT family DNA-binding domain-containing protein, partial [Clostridia bacterium]|nr:AbrB/MazE/SpoVT family DNA-binding domain-containing protein [Clostridia bacterium]
GIVRRIDDLGRVVIPKEIRRTMHIREGDPLEIYTDREGEVIFKKYSPIGEMQSFAAQYAETLYKTCSIAVAVCDRDAVTACAGISKKEYTDRKITAELDRIIENRTLYQANGHEDVFVVDGGAAKVSCAMPIITEGDITGCVASVYTDEVPKGITKDVETKLIQTAASFLGRQLEE